jgi:glutamate synthase (NADPH/NADH) large chain
MTGGIVVVIGQTGRNFAAGMSGGIAYVLDEDGTFPERCNMSMVDLEPVAEEEEELNQRLYHQGGDLHQRGLVDVMADMTRHDAERLKQLIANHLRHTGSQRARDILDNWHVMPPKFRKVMPVEDRRALGELMAQSEGSASWPRRGVRGGCDMVRSCADHVGEARHRRGLGRASA